MRVGVLGSGVVGRTLADGFSRHGQETMLGTRDTAKLADWQREHRMFPLPVRELGCVARAEHGFLTVARKTVGERSSHDARSKHTHSHMALSTRLHITE